MTASCSQSNLYLSPRWSSTYGTTLLAAGHNSSLSWLAPGSRRLSHCRVGTHHPHASLSACSFQPEISHIIYVGLSLMFLETAGQLLNGVRVCPSEASSWAETLLGYPFRQAQQ